MKVPGVDIITMGCSKNLIDSERLIAKIRRKGYAARHDPELPQADYVVVNTCGFIGDAKEESINMILNIVELKNRGKVGKIAVMGCLSERYLKDLKKEIPEVDFWYGKFDWNGFIDNLPELNAPEKVQSDKIAPRLTTKPWTAYVKISEGCDRYCAFCAIPLITGSHVSRPIPEIISEVEDLAKAGVKEINLIAQDLSSYGTDLYGETRLADLLERMATVEGIEWIRLHYLYPSDFPVDILDVINRHPNICKYLDLPLQHISDKVLKGMKRKITKGETLNLLELIKRKVPGIHLRTTIMTGFPGEGEEEFEELLGFIKEMKFDRLGGFAYCEEEDTLAAKIFEDTISSEEKERRLATIMEVQREIASSLNDEKIGSVLKVLVEENNDGVAIGRTEFDSPEVDQEVIIDNCNVEPGNFVMVEITSSTPYELHGNIISNLKIDNK